MKPIEANTTLCAVIGHPIAHSLSPAIHNAAYEALGLNFAYVAHNVAPERIEEAIAGVRAFGYRGLSVTIPHKVAAMRFVDEVDATARGIGCINTIVNDEGRLLGYNTDGRGALNALLAAGVQPRDSKTVVLGSGGAARAIAMTLAMEAAPKGLTLVGVEREELDRLVADIAPRTKASVQGRLLDNATLEEELRDADLLLHTSPVGMHPKVDQSLVPAQLLHPGLAVFDAVYNPRRTRLLSDAAAAGCRTVEGLEMFIGQAAVQIELFTGKKAPLDVLRGVMEAKL